MLPRIIQKPWGHEEIWAITEQYVGKILYVKADQRLSLQHHMRKVETMRLHQGSVILLLEDPNGKMQEHHMQPGDVIHIPPERKHRLTAITDSLIYEVSTPELDDVVRHKDDYGRTKGLDHGS